MLTKAQLKRRMQVFTAPLYRIRLRNKNFSIISNNCWGGAIYDRFGLPYKTPTVGLWFPSFDYIRFLTDIEYYLKQDLEQISWEDCHVANLLQQRKIRGKYDFELKDMIIGRLYDVDIIFLHYKSFDDAKKKWNRRKTRINMDNLIVKFNDQNGFNEELLHKFIELPYKNKIFFTANGSYNKYEEVYVINDVDREEGSVRDDTNLKLMPFNITEFLNSI